MISGQEAHTVYALQGNGIDRADTAGCNGCGWRVNEMYTLNTIDRPAIAFDCRNMKGNEELSDTLAARHDSSPCADRGQNVVAYTSTRFAEYREGCGTMRANGGDVGGVRRASSLSVYDARENGNGSVAPTMTGHHNANISDYTSVVVEMNDE